MLFSGTTFASNEKIEYSSDSLLSLMWVKYGEFKTEDDIIKCFGAGGDGESESGMVIDINFRSNPIDIGTYKFLKFDCFREDDSTNGMKLRMFFSDGTNAQRIVYLKNNEWYDLVENIGSDKELAQMHITPYPDTPSGGGFYIKSVSFHLSDPRSEEQIKEDEEFYNSVKCETGEIQEKGIFERFNGCEISKELLKNPSFDTLDNWAASNGASFEKVDGGAAGSCVKIFDREYYYSGIRQDILGALKANGAGNYKISAHFKADSPSPIIGNSCLVRILLKKSGKTTYYASSYPISDSWDENSNVVYIPYDENVTAAFFIVCGADSSESVYLPFYADECSLKKYSDAPDLYDDTYNAAEAKKRIEEIDGLAQARRENILNSADNISISGTKYYVSNNGNDDNSGLSPTDAWKSVERVQSADLKSGDGVFFERGGIWRGVNLACVSGVSYAAYGEGEKPKLYGSDKDYANAALWKETETENVWQTVDNIYGSAGFVSFNNGEKFAIKVSDKSELNADFTFYDGKSSTSPVFLYCEGGNPGDVYENIEIAPGRSIISAADKSDCVIDNLCLMYTGWHGIRFSCVENMKVTNCVIGYIGGTGETSRWGNGIEFWNSCSGSAERKNTVKGNYIFQIYDSALTNQYKGEAEKPSKQQYIEYSDNLIEYATYAFEFFSRQLNSNLDIMENITVSGNIMRYSGYGWGEENRPVKGQSADIKGWESKNRTKNFVIKNNISYMPKYAHIDWASFAYNLNFKLLVTSNRTEQYLPSLVNNTFVCSFGGNFGKFNGESYEMNYETKNLLAKNCVDKNAQILFMSYDGFSIGTPVISAPDEIKEGNTISSQLELSKNFSGENKKINFALCLYDGITLRAINNVEYTHKNGDAAKTLTNEIVIPNGIYEHFDIKAIVMDENFVRYETVLQ